MPAIKQRTKTKVKETIFPLTMRFPQSVYWRIVKEAKDRNMYLCEYVREVVVETLKRTEHDG